jgi:hypothetical protein
LEFTLSPTAMVLLSVITVDSDIDNVGNDNEKEFPAKKTLFTNITLLSNVNVKALNSTPYIHEIISILTMK